MSNIKCINPLSVNVGETSGAFAYDLLWPMTTTKLPEGLVSRH